MIAFALPSAQLKRATSRMARKQTLPAPEDGTHVPAPEALPCKSQSPSCSSATSCRWRASFACILATPRLFRGTPTRHPIGKSCVAVVRRRGGTHWRAPRTSLTRATLTMHAATPGLLAHRPTGLPISEPVGAIVRVSGGCWGNRHHGHRGWRHDRHDRLRASEVMNPAAPSLFVCSPCTLHTRCTIEWVNRP